MPKQQEIPGTEAPTIKAIEEAAEAYVSVRDRRMKLTEQEVTAKANLIAACEKHKDKLTPDLQGNRTYRYDEMIVVLKPGKDNVKVKTYHAGDEEEEDEA